MDNFCVEGTTTPKCATFETFDFDSEEQILDILLDVLKSQLPDRLQLIKGCDDKPLFITEDAIDLVPPEKETRFSVIVNPLGDVPKYTDNRIFREVIYDFELILTAINRSVKCVTWELIRFKNAVEGLMIGTELAIDGYNSVDLEPKGFEYDFPLVDNGKYMREGRYRFAVSVTQTKNN